MRSRVRRAPASGAATREPMRASSSRSGASFDSVNAVAEAATVRSAPVSGAATREPMRASSSRSSAGFDSVNAVAEAATLRDRRAPPLRGLD